MVRMSYVCISKGPSGSRSCLAIIGVDHDSILRLVRKLGEVQRTGHRMPRLNGSGNTKISTKCGSLAPVFIRFLCQRKIAQVARKVPSFLQRRELLPLTFVHGTGRMRRRDRLLFIEQPQLASTPFTRHRETGQSDRQKYGNQVGDATSGAIRFQSKRGIPQSHPLWHKFWAQALSTYVVYTAGPSQAIHLVVTCLRTLLFQYLPALKEPSSHRKTFLSHPYRARWLI